ncbi:MAG: primase-helicase family protein [Ottowia sp.]|uniref:primase-helicase family protein n=1 Tax=Ottowia sp. TaxID=1898956 RepID=UPI003C78B864
MSDIPPDLDASGASAALPGGGGASAPKREKRKKRFDANKLSRLFKDFRYEYGSNLAWDVVNRIPIIISNLRHTFGNDEVKMWMNSDKRQVVMPGDVVFDPACRCGPECVNLFGGLTMVPKAGDCQPIVDLLMHLVDDDETVHEWVLDWIAYQLQNPGAKLPTAIIMHGDEGSGKNLFWEGVMLMWGEYAAIVGQSELESQYNDWLSKRMFIIGDEVLSRQEMRHLKGKLKAMISGAKVQIQAKFMPVRMEANHVNIVFLSNELQPNALDSSDRRYLVVWTPAKREQAYYKAVKDRMQAGGLEAFMAMLLARDLSAFDPYAPPPRTKAKEDLIDLGRPNAERFWLAWSSHELPIPLHACSADQAYRAYKRWCTTEGERYPVTKPVFARMVARVAKDGLCIRKAKVRLMETARMWLPAPPPDDVDFGTWSRDSIDAFEAHLKEYHGEA